MTWTPPRREIAAGAKLIDVREQNEWDESHIEAAIHVPQGELVERLDEVAPDTSERLLLHCRTDNRSAKMAGELASLGYDNVAVVEGGIVAWESAGLPTINASGLTREQRNRYSRHTLLGEVGVEGQLKLLNAKVLLLGAGGLGAPTALYLAAAGIGTIGIVDDDVVDESNLQRQVIHNTERVGIAKTHLGADDDRGAQPRRQGDRAQHPARLVEHPRADRALRRDRRRRRQLPHPLPAQRRLGAAAQSRSSRPRSSASTARSRPSFPHEGPCYRCLYPVPPPPELAPSCGANGVLGVMAGVMGLLQANEVIKLVAGIGEPLVGRLLLYESLGTRFTELKVKRDPECPICGEHAPEIEPGGDGQVPRLRALLRRPGPRGDARPLAVAASRYVRATGRRFHADADR